MARLGSFVPSAPNAKEVACLWESKASGELPLGEGGRREEGYGARLEEAEITAGVLLPLGLPQNQPGYFSKLGWLL